MKLKVDTKYSQRDGQWASTMLGFNTNAPYNIGNFGCKLTCFAMYARAIGKQENPATLNEKFKATNQFTNGGELNSDNCFNVIFGDVNIKYQSRKYDDLIPDTLLVTMKEYLDQGYILFAEIDFYPATVNEDMHFVLINGYEGDKWLIVDPWTGEQLTLDVYGDIKRVLYRVWCYDRTVEKEGATITIPVATNDINVQKATQWDATVGKYVPNKDPKDALFPDLQAVVAGYLSVATTAQNAEIETEKKLALALTEVENQKDKVANIQADCQKSYGLLLGDYNTLKETATTVEKLRGQYQGTIDEQLGTIRALQKQGGLDGLTITDLKTQIESLKANQAKSYTVGDLLKLIWERVKVLDVKL